MASQGPNFPSAAVNVSAAPESAEAWVNPTNVFSDDGTETTITAATYDTPDISQQLVMSGFGFSIPGTATIDGIVVEIDRRNSAGAASDNRVQLRNASGTLVGTNKAATTTDWPTTTAVASYGSASDTWTASPTPAMVNDPDFGVVLSVQADAANTDIQVDFVRVTVHYTDTTPPPSTGSGSPVATLGATASGTATQTFEGSGSPTTTLSATAAGTGTNTPPSGPQGSGSPVATLSPFATGSGGQTFEGSGAPVATLSPFATGSGGQTFEGSGSATATLSATAGGSATMVPGPDPITGSGAAVATLSAFSSGSASSEDEVAPPPVRRRARGHFFHHTDPAPQPDEEETPVPEADPLPELLEIPAVELVEMDRARWQRALTRVNAPQPTQPTPALDQADDDDEYDLLQILAVL